MDFMSAMMARNSLDQIALEILLLLDGKSLRSCFWTCPEWRRFILDNSKELEFSEKDAKVALDEAFENGTCLPDPFWINSVAVGHSQFNQIGDREAMHFPKAASTLSHGMAVFNENYICFGHNCEGVLKRFKWSEFGLPANEELPAQETLIQLPTNSYNLKLFFRDFLIWRSSAADNHAMLNVSKLNQAASEMEHIVSLDLREMVDEVPQILDIIGWKKRLRLCQHGHKLLITFSPNTAYVATWYVCLFMIDLKNSAKVWQHLCYKRFESDNQSLWDYNMQPFIGHQFCGVLMNIEHVSNELKLLGNAGNVIWDAEDFIMSGKYYVASSKKSFAVVPVLNEVDDPRGVTYFFQISNTSHVRTTRLIIKEGLEGSSYWGLPSEGVLYADRYLGHCGKDHFYLHDLLSCGSWSTPNMRRFELPGKSVGSSYHNFTGHVWLCYLERKKRGKEARELNVSRGDACLLRFPVQPELQKVWQREKTKMILQ